MQSQDGWSPQLPAVMPAASRPISLRENSAWVKWPVITLALAFFALFLVLPLIAVFVEAFRKGATVYFAALTDPDAVAALKLTLTAAAIAVPLNLVFGVAAAWAVAKHDFRGKSC